MQNTFHNNNTILYNTILYNTCIYTNTFQDKLYYKNPNNLFFLLRGQNLNYI